MLRHHLKIRLSPEELKSLIKAEDEWRFEDKHRSFVMRTDFPVHRDPKMKRREHPWDNVYLIVELVVVVKIRLEEDEDEYDSEDEEGAKWRTNEMSCGWARINFRELDACWWWAWCVLTLLIFFL